MAGERRWRAANKANLTEVPGYCQEYERPKSPWRLLGLKTCNDMI
ncbi:hypothetical protein KOY48_01230 [Candidatus Minimicrobia naudis]|uniref:ParB-like N-terminal domain-containing protein n=1 Tax=Candidatus Minimicrobia naudis TaxID=2841263 RepID=A0A8F1MCC2_9BACT|nr:hypothetical protein KOY48_01230 [Candidatus Minimicrobia naudis]